MEKTEQDSSEQIRGAIYLKSFQMCTVVMLFN